MFDVNKTIGEKGGTSTPILRGSDLPPKTAQIVVKCVDIRDPGPRFRSPLVMDIEPVKGKGTIALNATNTRKLAELLGDGNKLDERKARGKRFRFVVVLVNNPATKKATRSLSLDSIVK
jgi:hypothetical protein